jgi:hypothetical protein
MPTFADRGCHVVSVTDPYGRILGFLDRSRYFFFQVAPELYSQGWVDHTLVDNSAYICESPYENSETAKRFFHKFSGEHFQQYSHWLEMGEHFALRPPIIKHSASLSYISFTRWILAVNCMREIHDGYPQR